MKMTSREFLRRINELPGYRLDYSFSAPFHFLQVTEESPSAAHRDGPTEETVKWRDVEECIAKALDIPCIEVQNHMNGIRMEFVLNEAGGVALLPRRDGDSFVRHYVLSALTDAADAPSCHPPLSLPSRCRILHGCGYAGDEGRPDFIAAFAKRLVAESARVLVVDLDMEAPMLGLLCPPTTQVLPENTLLGLRRNGTALPLEVNGTSNLSLLPLCPIDPEHDIESVAFAEQVAQSRTEAVTHTARKLAHLLASFDFLLINHLSGVSPVVPGWISELKGTVLVFAEMDRHRPFLNGFRFLWQKGGGILISPTRQNTPSDILEFSARNGDRARKILGELSGTTHDALDAWIPWPVGDRQNGDNEADADSAPTAATDTLEAARAAQIEKTMKALGI